MADASIPDPSPIIVLDTSVDAAVGVGTPSRDVVGGKGAGLWQLRGAGLPVPPFAVIASDHVEAVARGQHGALLQRTIDAIGAPLAVRSSAVDEDGGSSSFAGQHHSVIGVSSMEDVQRAVAACVASFDSEGARAYRAARGLPAGTCGAVVVQRLVQADVAGVAFSRDPDGGDGRSESRAGTVVVSACLGLGEGVVADRAPADTFRIDADGTITASIAIKDTRVVAGEHGVCVDEAVDDVTVQQAPVLADEALRVLAAMVRRLEEHVGVPVDVEWVWTRRAGFSFVQVRPITGLKSLTLAFGAWARDAREPSPHLGRGTPAGADRALVGWIPGTSARRDDRQRQRQRQRQRRRRALPV